MLEEKWHIVLLNGLQACRRGQTVDRFRTQKTGELLAFLALHIHRFVPREEIAGIVWPDNTLEAGRASLRTALASLRQQLEPPGTLANSVLLADRTSVRLCPDAVRIDVTEFEAAGWQADNAPTPQLRLQAARQAVDLYAGDLLPGYYADWILAERVRLSQIYRHHLRHVVFALRDSAQSNQALLYASRLIATEPYEEEARLLAIRLYAETGQIEAARRCFEEWKRVLQDELQTSPSSEACLLAQQIYDRPFREHPPLPSHVGVGSQAISTSQQTGATVEVALPQENLPLPIGRTSPLPAARLPLTLTRFFGRETEIMQVARLLSPSLEVWRSDEAVPTTRLVTLTGTGGAGKTRLAIEVGRRLHAQADLPVTFVSLADIRESSHIPEAIANALTLSPNSTRALYDEIAAELSKCPQVLILDNFEHLLSEEEATTPPKPERAQNMRGEPERCISTHAVSVVQTLLERAPTLRCLVTSRQCLNLEGEQEYPVHPLPTPAYTGTPDRLLEFASVNLFVNRAQLSRPDFQLTPRNADVVAELCAQLEGLPLALELAAAWVSMLSPAQIQERLGQRFDLLVGRKRGRVSRHHSLRAAIEWSYQLLDPDLREFFAGLAIFRGGWTLEAAEQVCGDSRTLEYLNALRERSLIVFDAGEEKQVQADTPGTARYGMLETLREFADDKLEEAQRERLAERHARWCLECLKQQDFALVEQANYYAAHRWAQSQPGQDELYFQLLSALARFWRAKGWWRGGLTALQTGLERDGSAYPAAYGGLYRGAANLAWLLKELETASRYYELALPLCTLLENSVAVMDIHNGMGCVTLEQGDLAATRRHFEQALRLAEKEAHLPMIATMRGNLGYVAMQMQDWPAAEEHMQTCLRILEANQSPLAWAWQNLGALALALAQWPQARGYLEQSLEQYRQLGETYRIAEVLEQLAEALEADGEAEAAQRCREESQTLALQLRAV